MMYTAPFAEVTAGYRTGVVMFPAVRQVTPSVLASTDGVTWRTAGNITTPVRYPAVTSANGAVYIIGGVTSNGTDTSAVQRYDPKTGATTVIAQLPAPTSHASAVALDTSVYE